MRRRRSGPVLSVVHSRRTLRQNAHPCWRRPHSGRCPTSGVVLTRLFLQHSRQTSPCGRPCLAEQWTTGSPLSPTLKGETGPWPRPCRLVRVLLSACVTEQEGIRSLRRAKCMTRRCDNLRESARLCCCAAVCDLRPKSAAVRNLAWVPRRAMRPHVLAVGAHAQTPSEEVDIIEPTQASHRA